MPSVALSQSRIPGLSCRRGKVRDVYDLGDRLLLVATDRISAFDWILDPAIPDKGRILTQLSKFWFCRLSVENHLITTDLADMDLPAGTDRNALEGRTMLVRKTKVVPIECVARGYLAGSGWKEYRTSGTVCGITLPAGLREGDQLPEPIFTPATKAETGHDENISFEIMVDHVGQETSVELRDRTLDLYRRGAQYAESRGVIIADTKFEWGQIEGRHILIDEVLTPDSSRFWPKSGYAPGRSQPSFDKQFVRDWLEDSGWDKNSPPPTIPDEVVQRTREKYVEAYELLTGERFS